MNTRVKLLVAGALLTLATFSAPPAQAMCRALPYDGIYSDEECQAYCWGWGCYNHYWDGGSGCFCS